MTVAFVIEKRLQTKYFAWKKNNELLQLQISQFLSRDSAVICPLHSIYWMLWWWESLRTTEHWLVVNKGHHFNCVPPRTCFWQQHLAPKVWPLCNVFSLHLFKGNWLKDSCASHIEHCPCSTINLCQAKTQYKAALRKVSKLVVSDLQLCVWNLKWSSSLGIPPSPPILSLSANLSVRQKMYTAP